MRGGVNGAPSPKCIPPRGAENSGARQMGSSVHSGALATIIQTVRPARGVTSQRVPAEHVSALWSGAATSGQFISFLPRVEISYRRGKGDGCWGVASTQKRTKHAPLRSSASDVGHFIRRLPSLSAPSSPPFGPGFSITRINLPSARPGPFVLAARESTKAPSLEGPREQRSPGER